MAAPRRLVVAGKLLVDEVLALAGPALPGTQQRARGRRLTGGGQVWHTARAAALAGAAVTVVGAAGEDADGTRLRAELVAAGVDDRLVASGSSPRALVLVAPAAERAIVSIGGGALLPADALLSAADRPPGVLEAAGWLQVDGYGLDDLVGDAVLPLVREAARRGIPLSLEPPSLAGLPARLARIAALPPLDLLLGRPEEVEALLPVLAGRPGAIVRHDGPGDVVLERGRASVRVAVPPRDDVDTTGAGDRFAGGLLAALLAGATDEAAVRAGIAAAQG